MVEREYPKFLFVGFGTRLVAFLIDLFAIKSIFTIMALPIINILGIEKTGMFFSIYNLINLFVYLGYFFLLTYFNQGQTLGKMIMGIKVISLDKDKLTMDTVFYREVLGRFILKKLSVFYLMIFFNRDKQELADFFAGTSVVNSEYFYEYMKLKESAKLTEEILEQDPGADYSGEDILVSEKDEENI